VTVRHRRDRITRHNKPQSRPRPRSASISSPARTDRCWYALGLGDWLCSASSRSQGKPVRAPASPRTCSARAALWDSGKKRALRQRTVTGAGMRYESSMRLSETMTIWLGLARNHFPAVNALSSMLRHLPS